MRLPLFLRTSFHSFMSEVLIIYHIETSPLNSDWVLYDKDIRHERFKEGYTKNLELRNEKYLLFH